MLHRYLSPFSEFGAVYGLLYVADRMLARATPELRLFCYDLMAQPVASQPLLPAGLRGRFATREIRRGDAEVALMPARPEIKEARFARGCVCVGIFRDGRLASYLWLSPAGYEEDEVRCTFELRPGGASVFDFDLYVLPDHRMSFAFAAVWDAANAYLRDRGITYSFSRVTHYNAASRRAHLKLGATTIGRAIFLKAWRLQVMVASVSPYVHISCAPHRRARIVLRAAHRAMTGSPPEAVCAEHARPAG